MIRRLIAAVLALALTALPITSRAAAADPGPAWWRIDNGGGSVLWVLGIPDGMIENFRWSDASLRTRLSAARLLISPLLSKSLTEPDPGVIPWDYSLPTTPGGARSLRGPIFSVWERTVGAEGENGGGPATLNSPLTSTLPLALLQRFNADVGASARSYLLNATPGDAALWLDLWNWPQGDHLGNPVVDRAQSIAQGRRLAIDVIHVPALWKPILLDDHPAPLDNFAHPDFDWLWNIRPNIRIVPPQELQIKCLAQVLDQTETGQMPALRQAAMEAWARGDLDNALKRSNDVQYCLMGDLPSTSAKNFILNQAATYLSSLDHAFDQPGETVALVEFDPLLLAKGGVLDHYRSLGYDIAQGDGMDPPTTAAPAQGQDASGPN